MFNPTWKYHAIAAAKRIDTQEELDALNSEWADSPAEAMAIARLQNNPEEAERLAQIAAEENALKAHLDNQKPVDSVDLIPGLVDVLAGPLDGLTLLPPGEQVIPSTAPPEPHPAAAEIAQAVAAATASVGHVETEEEELERLERETRPTGDSEK